MRFKKETLLGTIKSEMCLRKIIALCLLAIVAGFVLMHVSAFKKERIYEIGYEPRVMRNEPLAEKRFVYAPFMGDNRISREFVAEANEIQRVSVGFLNTKIDETKGTITVSLVDSNGNVVAKSESPAAEVLSVDPTVFDFVEKNNEYLNEGDVTSKNVDLENDTIRIKKGAKYSIVVEGKGISNSDRFSVKVMRGTRSEILEENDMYLMLKYYRIQYKMLIAVLLMILLAALFAICPMNALSENIKDGKYDLNKVFTRTLFFLAPFAGVMFNELVSGKAAKEILERMGTNIFWLNLFVVYGIWILAYTLCNRTKWAGVTTVLFWSIYGLVNFALMQFRNIPFTVADLASMGTAMDVAQNYSIVFDGYSVTAIAGSVTVCAMLMSLEGYKGLSFRKRIIPLLALILYAGVYYYLFYDSTYMKEHNIKVTGFRPRLSYEKNGYPLSFAVQLAHSTIRKPEGYSVEEVESVAEKYKSDTATGASKVSKERPNLIVIMSESLADMNWVTKIEKKNDEMPYIHSLKDNVIMGKMHVSTFGGGTANSEYEFLTGNSLAIFPMNTVPFNSNIKEDTPSLVKNLKQIGYPTAIAFHPGMRDSYNRNNVYPNLGFDKHIALDDLKEPEMIRKFVSDAYDFQVVKNEYESFRNENKDDPFFMFNVTIQNHGGFALKTGIIDDRIHILDPELDLNLVRQYLNLMKYTDEAIEDLFKYFENVDEPTAIVVYGDHQPNLGDTFDMIASNRSGMDTSTAEFSDTKYQTPFIIWANYDIEEKSGIELSDNYFGAFVMESLGMPMTGYDKFRLDMWKQIPFYTKIAYSDDDGNVYSTSEYGEGAKSDVIDTYNILQYNNIMDRRHRVENFFKLSE